MPRKKEWWMDQSPQNQAIYWTENGEEHNVSDIDAFYDYLVEQFNRNHS